MSQDILILDSTQISQAFECIKMWSLQNEEHLVLTDGAPNDPIAMGSLGHKYLELFYKKRAEGKDISSSLEEALEFNPNGEVCKCGHAKENHLPILDVLSSIPVSEYVGTRELGDDRVVCSDCKDVGEAIHIFEGLPYPLDKEKRGIVSTRVREYVYKWINNDFVPARPENVELGFSHVLLDDPTRLYVLEGKIDLIVTHQTLDTYVDHKFQMKRKELYKKAIQFKNYALVTGYKLACINYIRLTKKIDKDTYERKFVSFNQPELDFWKTQLISFYDKVVRLRKEGIKPEDYNWGMCSGKFGYECVFTSLCEESYNPNVIASKKQQYYHIKKVEWKPW